MAYAARRSYAGAAPACTLTNAITSGDTSALLTGDVTNWNNTANGAFFMVIDPGLSTEEKVLVGSRSGSSLSSITRGVDGTSAASHNAGATCYPVFTAVDADQANAVAAALTTKGDLLATDGSALNRLAVGTNDYALLADSSAANGVAWKQIPSAGLASDAVTTAKILNANVTADKLATDAVTTAKIADLNVTGAKLANPTVSTKTDSYTLVAADRNTRIAMNSGSDTTVTVNTSLFDAGDTLFIQNIGAGTCTITAGTATVATAGSLALAQWAGGMLYFTSASASIYFPSGVAVKQRQVAAFTASGTWTVPAGVTYAVAYIRAGGGGVGTAASGTGGTSSVAFAGGTVSAVGGVGVNVFATSVGNSQAGPTNSGSGATIFAYGTGSFYGEGGGKAQDGALITAGDAVTPAASITVTVGDGGTAGTSGAAGGSGYVYIEYLGD